MKDKDLVDLAGDNFPLQKLLHKQKAVPCVSVIIVTCNNKKILAQCLNSVTAVDYENIEIIVIDNGSSDGTSKFVSEHFPYVKLVRSNKNLGYAAGNNLGMKNANGTYLILLNDDTIVEPQFIDRLVRAMEAEPRAALGSCKIYMIRGKTLLYAGGYTDKRGYPVMRGCGEEDVGKYDMVEEVEWASGACMIIRSEYLQYIGFLDESFHFYYEDTDLSFRARRLGYKVIYIPNAVIRHIGSTTTQRHWRYQVFSSRNHIRFLLRHFGRSYAARSIALQLRYISPRKAPFLLISLIWNWHLIVSAIFKPKNNHALEYVLHNTA
jgi:hypothetical protein